MKQKSIEKIPYLTLPKCSREKSVKYVGVTAVIEIGGEAHLFLEVYQNIQEARQIPAVRIVVAPKDYGAYFPEQSVWKKRKIRDDTWNAERLIWQSEKGYKSNEELAKETILCGAEDQERIEQYCQDVNVWNRKYWWELICRKQEQIQTNENYNRRKRKAERRERALKERAENTPKLPEERIRQYAAALWQGELWHRLYYKKHGSRVTVACSACGGVADRRWKPGQSYESQFESCIQEPRQGEYGHCPLCKAWGKYIPQGKTKAEHEERKYVYLGQKYKEKGAVIRYIVLARVWALELMSGDQGLEISGAGERLEVTEIARAYFEPEKSVQTDYHKYSFYTNQIFWDDCNLCGNSNINIEAGSVMPETYKNLQGTFLQHSALREFVDAESKVKAIDYLERYVHTPQIEMLTKMGMFRIVNQLILCRYGIVASASARNPAEFLGIRKDRVKLLRERQGDLALLEAAQMERRREARWTNGQLEALAELRIKSANMTAALQYMSLQKLLNRIRKYAGCEYGTGCSRAEARLRDTAVRYLDYLEIRQALGYDLHNTVYQHPRDLNRAHDRMVWEQNEKEQDKRLEKVKILYSGIRQTYRQLRGRYYYEREDYVIRPARSAEEIVMEGRLLHHCVGGDRYLEGHNDGHSYILLLRHKDEPEKPYITVEISPDTNRICQWYGVRDTKPEKEKIERWLKSYTAWLATQAAGDGAPRQRIIA